MDNIMSKILCIYKLIEKVIIPIFFLFLIAYAFSKGGRWDMYEPLAMADRFADAFGYSAGKADGFKPSTPYFPGVTLIALLSGVLSNTYQVEVMLIIAVSLIAALFWLLYLIYKEIGGSGDAVSFFIIAAFLSLVFFRSWLWYAVEFKPDTAALVFFCISLMVVLKGKLDIYSLTIFTLSIAASFLFKQQAISVISGLALGVLLSPKRLKTKIIFLALICIGLVISVIIIARFDNAYFHTVVSNMGRPNVSILDVSHLKLIGGLVGIVIIARLFNNKETSDTLKKAMARKEYIFPSILWLAASVAGAINFGGNIGNTAAGCVLLIPLLGLIFDRKSRWFRLIFGITVVILTSGYLVKLDWAKQYSQRVALDKEISGYLQKMGIDRILISGDSYLAVRNSRVKNISEINTWGHILLGRNTRYAYKDGSELIREIDPDVIVCVEGCSVFKDPSGSSSFDPKRSGYKDVFLKETEKNDVLYFK